jgi:hypothetical protein
VPVNLADVNARVVSDGLAIHSIIDWHSQLPYHEKACSEDARSEGLTRLDCPDARTVSQS